MNKKSQIQFAHKCSILLESGISLSETLELICRLEKSKKNLTTIIGIKENVAKGISLSRSIVLTKVKFEPTLLSMITFGEESGILASAMRQALEILEKGNLIQKKLIGALIYPAFIAAATVAMTVFLVMYIFPKIIPLFSSLNITLPFLTRAVRGLYEFIIHFGLGTGLLGFIFLSLFIFLYKRKISFRTKVQEHLLKLPGLGPLLQKYYLVSACRSLGTLLECGQTLPVILLQISLSSPSEVYKKSWKVVHDEINRGIPISNSLQLFKKYIPQIVPDMLSIGERTGSLASMFHHVSRMYEEELDEFCKQLGTIIEPVLMIGMGLIVGSVALSIILPIYEVTNHLSH